MDKHAVILFTRVPVPGKAKTRLLPLISGDDCAALQRAMTLDTAWTLTELNRDLYVFYSDEGPVELLEGLPPAARLFPQSGSDLGARMRHALETVLGMGHASCLLLGADLPFLEAADVAAAGVLLEERDVVLCPSPDGGYWLVGLRAPFSPLFTGQRYGGESVLADALACCNADGLRVGLGPVRADLDTPEDLQAVLAAMEKQPRESRTASWLRQWKDLQP